MTETEKMVREMNGLFRMTGDEELVVPKFDSELELLQKIKAEYKSRLLEKVPKYRLIPFERLNTGSVPRGAQEARRRIDDRETKRADLRLNGAGS
jgi:hypothetical protein